MTGGRASFSFRDCIVVVTGAAGGIGSAVAELFATAGAHVIAADRAAGSTERRQRSGTHWEARTLHVDDSSSVRRLFEDVAGRYGHVDVLVNAAGITGRAKSADLPLADWSQLLAVNLTGTLLCSQEAARLMQAGDGAIVNIASELALAAEPEKAAYITSKAGVIGLTRSLAVEWAAQGIRVNAVAPGATRTPMIAALEADEAERSRYLARAPVHRFGEAAQIAQVVAFLASDAASHIIGQVLVVDGGYTVA